MAKGHELVRGSGRRIPLWVALISMAASAFAQQPGIHYAEPIDLSLAADTAQFDAYGRRFSLTLTDNARVLQKLSVQRKRELAPYRLLRGSLDGQPGSWVRLVEAADGVEGAIWDGHDLYAVTSHRRIAASLLTPIAAAPDQTVVYRLSDAREVLPRDFCALAAAAQPAKSASALDQYQAIVRELQQGIVLPTLTRQIEISLIGDSDLQAAISGDATAAMLARLNIVEGIFSEQLGLLILATDVRLMPAAADPFVSTRGATLLEALGKYRAATPEVRARGLAHLITGKDLDGGIAGVAYVKTVCDTELGVSLSQHSFGTTISALIMAHELGHNFGASHDSEPGTPCAGTGGGFIMAPSISAFVTFSQCSLDTMRPVIESASCVTAAEYADVAVEMPAGNVAGESGVPFAVPIVINSNGNRTAEDVVLTVTLPSNAIYAIDSASSSQGSCSVSGFTATCALGTVPNGEQRQVTVTARSNQAANFAMQARVVASNDRITSNNNREMSVSVRSGIDVAVVLSTNAAEVALGQPIEIYADVSSLRSQSVRNALLSLSVNQAVTAAAMTGGTCTANASSVTCSLAEIPSGVTRRLTLVASTQAAGPLFAGANVSAVGDGDFANNTDNASAWIQAERDVELTAGPAQVDLGVGTTYDVPLTLRSRGSAPTGDITLSISIPSSALAVESVDAGGAACTRPDAFTYRCALGALGVGATRLVRLRVRGTGSVTADITAQAETTDDGYAANNFAGLQLRIDHLVDLAVVIASGGSGVEDTAIEGQVSLRSNGRQAATNATLDIDLHAAGVLRSATIHNGAACVLLSAQRARCQLPSMARNAQLFVDYHAEFAEPGTYGVAFTVATAGDTAPDNDSLVRVMLARPYNDIAVAGALDLANLFEGETRETTFTLTTGRRALATARFIANHYLPGLRVDAIRASLDQGIADCRVDVNVGGICDFTDLPANTGVTVTVTYRAAEGSFSYEPVASVTTPGDVFTGNDHVRGWAETHAVTDLALQVGATVDGSADATLEFPQISVINGGERAFGTRLEVSLPAQVTLVDVSASNAICSGTAVLRCDFDELPAGSMSTVRISVRASVSGSFTSSLKLTSSNDNNAANDVREVAFQITAKVAGSAGKSGGGGGGRMEWLALVLLCGLAWRRARVVPGEDCRDWR